MFRNQKVLVVVPARGGSKGVPLKNLRQVGGVPLIGYVGRLLSSLLWVDRAVVSTDHDQIAAMAQQFGLDVPFRRPSTLSGDLIGDIDVLTHALHATEEDDGCHYDVVVMLQPTSPFRTAAHVTETVSKLVEGGFNAVWTVSETDSKSHPLKQLIVKDDALSYYDPNGKDIIARQQLTPVYHRNGIAYALTRTCLLGDKTLMGRKTGCIVVKDPCVNIDSEFDIALAEFVLRNDREKNV